MMEKKMKMQPKTTVSTTKQEFQARRSQFIGSSEIGTIMGVNPYQTPLQLWEQKTGRTPSFSGNKYTIAGNRLEQVIVEYFVDETDYGVINNSEGDIHYIHPVHDFISATPDRKYICLKDKPYNGILECKSTQRKIDKEEIPLSWFCQNQWQIGLAGLEDGAIAWLERGVDFDYMEFELNAEFFDEMINKAGEFWTKHVLTDTPPDPIKSEDINRLYDHSKIGKVLEAREDMLEAHQQLLSLRKEKKDLSEKIEELTEQVKMTMRDAEGVSYIGNLLFTWKTSKPSSRFDWRAFKKDHPELYEQYLKSVPGTRRFLVKS